MKRRVEITVETKRVLLLTRRRTSLRAWCADCAQHVAMLPPEEAASVTGLTARAIYRQVDDGSVHFIESADGALLVCSGSAKQNELNSEGGKQ